MVEKSGEKIETRKNVGKLFLKKAQKKYRKTKKMSENRHTKNLQKMQKNQRKPPSKKCCQSLKKTSEKFPKITSEKNVENL